MVDYVPISGWEQPVGAAALLLLIWVGFKELTPDKKKRARVEEDYSDAEVIDLDDVSDLDAERERQYWRVQAKERKLANELKKVKSYRKTLEEE